MATLTTWTKVWLVHCNGPRPQLIEREASIRADGATVRPIGNTGRAGASDYRRTVFNERYGLSPEAAVAKARQQISNRIARLQKETRELEAQLALVDQQWPAAEGVN
jgi:hypothetical protein